MRRVLAALGAGLACASPAFALDLAGAGEEPGLIPSAWWVAWGNDYQGNAPAIVSDDYRTNRFDVGLRLGSWRLALDWSNLTARAPRRVDAAWGSEDPHAASVVGAARSDELTVSVQWQGGEVGPTGRWWAVGPALRLDGPLGGSGLQGVVHAGTDSHTVELPYERRSVRLVPGLAGQAGMGTGLGGPWVVQARAATLTTTRVEVSAETSLRVGLAAGGSAVWIGPLYALREGSAATRVARLTADHERGLWLAGGLEVPGVVMSVGNQLGGKAVEGRLTVRGIAGRAPSSAWPCEAEAGVIPWGRQPRANEWTLRILVGLPTDDAWGQRLRVTIEGLRGDLDVPNTYDMIASIRRGLVGVQLAAWPVPAQGFVAQPYLGLGGGVQVAEVHPISGWAVTEATRHRTAVASTEIGLRLGWAAEGLRTGVTLAGAWIEVDRNRQVPWRLGDREGVSELARDGTEGHLRWWVAFGW